MVRNSTRGSLSSMRTVWNVWLATSFSYASVFAHPSPAWDPETACSSSLVHKLNLKDSIITNITHLAAGTNITIPEPDSACENPWYTTEASICRVQVTVNTSNASSLLLEAWLPDEWYGRYLGTGNGGLAGCLRWTDLNHGAFYHFATVSTNTGHKGDVGLPFLGHPEVLRDWVYRDIETEARIGKAITTAYYAGRTMGKSYYTGCSAGGRQGIRAINSFPDIYDGVIAGAPAIDWNHLMALGATINRIMHVDGVSPSLLSDADLDLISQDVLDQCDELDGVKDGMIDDPDLCQYQPERLLCGSYMNTTTTGCLNSEQVEAVHGLFSPLLGEDGQELYPRYDPGMTSQLPRYLWGPELYSYPLDWWRYAIYNDSSFNTTNFSAHDITAADRIDPSGASTYLPGAIQPFIARGGKLLTFHGTQDELIPSGSTQRYYRDVARALSNTSSCTIESSYRHFQIPGMSHCSRGPAAWQLAQSGTAIEGLQNDTEKNLLLTMVEWVEGGHAPDVMVGTKFFNDTPDMGIQRQRTYCPYPKRSVWNGIGDTDKADSWVCT